MIFRGIKVRVLKRSGKYVSYMLVSSNSKMRMRLEDFEKNVEDGVYVLQNPDMLIEA